MDLRSELKNELGQGLLSDVSLAGYSRIGVGGPADYFFEAKTVDDLIKAISAASRYEVCYRVIGEGNNILFSDSGFAGMIIKNLTRNMVFSSSSSEVIVDSGVDLKSLINSSASKDLGGLEFLSGFTDTIGGAIKGNLSDGFYYINDFVKSITLAFRRGDELAIANLSPKKLDFHSKYFGIKGLKDEYPPVVLTVCLQLVYRRKDEILKLISENLSKREHIQSKEKVLINCFKENVGQEIPTNELLRIINAKKQKVGGAIVARRNLNTVVNQKNASAADIRGLIELLRGLVNDKFGICLEERIEYIGQW